MYKTLYWHSRDSHRRLGEGAALAELIRELEVSSSGARTGTPAGLWTHASQAAGLPACRAGRRTGTQCPSLT